MELSTTKPRSGSLPEVETASRRAFANVADPAEPELFSCTWRTGYGVKWATLAGELDAFTAPLLESALHDAEAEVDLVVVDLRSLAFMDCSSIRVISQSSERLRQSGRLMVVVRGFGAVAKVLDLLQAAGAVHVFALEPAEPAFQVLLRLAAFDDLVAQRSDLFGDRRRRPTPGDFVRGGADRNACPDIYSLPVGVDYG